MQLLKPIALRMVYQVYKAVQIPIIGMGEFQQRMMHWNLLWQVRQGLRLELQILTILMSCWKLLKLNNYMGENGIEDLKRNQRYC